MNGGTFWFLPDNVTSIGDHVFNYCSSLVSVNLSDSVTSIGETAFTGCSSMTSVTIPNSVTDVGAYAFARCSSLTGVTIGCGVTTIGFGAFQDCSSLTGIAIPNSVTSIASYTFWGCTSLTSATIGNSVFGIGTGTFRDCSGLSAVYFTGDAPIFDLSIFHGGDNTMVYCLPGRTGWGETFGGRSVVEIGVLPDPLIGGTPIEGLEGWFLSEWLGEYSSEFAPWLFHAEHGYIYRYSESTHESMFFYDYAMGAWWWTNQSVYPFIYVYDPPADNAGTDVEDAWLFYFEGSNAPRVFGVLDGGNAGEALFFGP